MQDGSSRAIQLAWITSSLASAMALQIASVVLSMLQNGVLAIGSPSAPSTTDEL
jgi:hypothetical protein